jgi:plastocyanin
MRLLLVGTALLGGAGLAVTAVAGSETIPTIEAVNVGGGIYGEEHHWSPATATVGVGGTVTISNPSEVKHGVYWVGGPATPECSGIPVGSTEAASGTKWSGSCRFATAGVYTFYCTVHKAAMTGRITVNAEGVTTVTTTTQPSPYGTPTTTSPAGETAPGTTPPTVTAHGSPLIGGAAKAIKLAAGSNGGRVHGSIAVSQAGAKGRLEVDLLARSATLASAGNSQQLLVGRFVRSSLAAGTVRFSVALDGRAKRALARHGHLVLGVRVILTPLAGAPLRVLRGVVLHA